MPNKYLHIDEQSVWDDAAEQLRKAPQLALDTERNGRFAYKERICLIQICDGLETYLVDPLAVKDLSVLGQQLADETVVKVMHGCEEDIRYFDGDYGFPVCNVFDTGLAARFLGSDRPNLGAVLEEFAGVVIPKTPGFKFRTGDCGRCPGRPWNTPPATYTTCCPWPTSCGTAWINSGDRNGFTRSVSGWRACGNRLWSPWRRPFDESEDGIR